MKRVNVKEGHLAQIISAMASTRGRLEAEQRMKNGNFSREIEDLKSGIDLILQYFEDDNDA